MSIFSPGWPSAEASQTAWLIHRSKNSLMLTLTRDYSVFLPPFPELDWAQCLADSFLSNVKAIDHNTVQSTTSADTSEIRMHAR